MTGGQQHCVFSTLAPGILFICALNLLKIRKINDRGGFSMTRVTKTHRRFKKNSLIAQRGWSLLQPRIYSHDSGKYQGDRLHVTSVLKEDLINMSNLSCFFANLKVHMSEPLANRLRHFWWLQSQLPVSTVRGKWGSLGDSVQLADG